MIPVKRDLCSDVGKISNSSIATSPIFAIFQFFIEEDNALNFFESFGLDILQYIYDIFEFFKIGERKAAGDLEYGTKIKDYSIYQILY